MKLAAQRWNHIYGCYKKRLRASNGFAELCFPSSKWITREKKWTDHGQAHLDRPEMIPTQCKPSTMAEALHLLVTVLSV